jgi:ABC-2 type transport system ATP-binding protein
LFFSTHITSDLDKVADVIILIDNGQILLNENKDELLDRHAIVKGDNQLINERTRKLFLSLHQTAFGFDGITNKKEEVREQMNDVIIERPTIEQVMLAYVGGGLNAF